MSNKFTKKRKPQQNLDPAALAKAKLDARLRERVARALRKRRRAKSNQ
ncbi:MAG: hypothetical protein QM831_15560 [Kofleriaceae bacterium]